MSAWLPVAVGVVAILASYLTMTAQHRRQAEQVLLDHYAALFAALETTSIRETQEYGFWGLPNGKPGNIFSDEYWLKRERVRRPVLTALRNVELRELDQEFRDECRRLVNLHLDPTKEQQESMMSDSEGNPALDPDQEIEALVTRVRDRAARNRQPWLDRPS